MIFESIYDQLEASKPVEVGGHSLVVVEVAGSHYAIPAEVFELLFRPAESATRKESLPVATTPKKTSPKKKAEAARRPSPAQPADGMKTTEAVLQAVAEQPRTTAEVIERAAVILGVGPVPGDDWKKRLYANIDYNLRAGKLVRKTDPATQLTKIHLGGAQ